MTCRLYLIDDHSALREGMRILLETRGQFQVVGESDNAVEALADPRLKEAQLVLLDLSLPGMDGLQLLVRLQESHPHLRSVVFSVHQDEATVLAALERGACGYLVKSASSWELVYALNMVAQGGTFLHPSVAPSILKHVRSRRDTGQDNVELTEREVEILQRLAGGDSSRQVSEGLFLSPNTIKTHLRRIYRKLGVQDKTQAVLRCLEEGLLLSPKTRLQSLPGLANGESSGSKPDNPS